jgi:DNA-binding NtrC family response regulator
MNLHPTDDAEAHPAPTSLRSGVLVVEDDLDIAEAIGEILAEEGFHTVLASTVAQAVEHAGRERPGLVLLDWNLPDGTGEHVVRAIGAAHPSIPIVVMSAASDALQESLALTVCERLAKPFDLDRLVDVVRRCALS